MQGQESLYVKLARRTIEEYVLAGERICIKGSCQMNTCRRNCKKGRSLCFHQEKGELRGCIGTIQATRPNLAEEIISNAISAASRIPVFLPLARKSWQNWKSL